MKLSTRGRYTTKAIVDLALNSASGPAMLKDIAERQGISQRYLGQLIIPLTDAGMVKGIRGRGGGFMLAKPPGEITLSEIIAVSEGRISFEECVEKPELCEKSDSCVIRDVWSETIEAVEKVLNSTTLQDLIDRQAGKETACPRQLLR
ncbi:RrF2 family transcriptional regulator [Chloroflexota bacterium]